MDGLLGEQAGDLERSGHAHVGAAVHGQARDVFALEVHRAFGGLQLTGEHVEEGGFAGAVRTDQSQPFSGLDAEGHMSQGRQTSEVYGDVLDVKQSHGSASSIL